MIFNKNNFFSVLLLLFSIQTYSQSTNKGLEAPKVGEKCPEFMFSKIDFWKTDKLSLSDLRGKWVILDFWSIGCSGCVSDLPNVSRQQLEYGDKVQFIMVGPDSREGDPDADRRMYANYHKKLNLSMPSAFDSDLVKSFNVGLLPHTVIIDPQGIVQAITVKPDSQKLKELISGKIQVWKSPDFRNEDKNAKQGSYDRNKLLLIDDNGGASDSFLFRSILSKWYPGSPSVIKGFGLDVVKLANEKGEKSVNFEIMPINVLGLYRLAYFGKHNGLTIDDKGYNPELFQKPLVEVSDKSIFEFDRISGENMFCYSLTIPVDRFPKLSLDDIIKNELNLYFGYVVKEEIRKMPYWKLIANDKAIKLLETKGGQTSVKGSSIRWAGVSMVNVPVSTLLSLVQYYSGIGNDGAPVVDATNITKNIDISLDWAKEFSAVKKALQEHGLDLVRDEKPMKVIVIKDQIK